MKGMPCWSAAPAGAAFTIDKNCGASTCSIIRTGLNRAEQFPGPDSEQTEA